ncbi:hypothetical protein [Micromonospora sp. DT233]|uniref:hypothetical protein n=1 Tax=Micromonospora sp. DT233 TaxID=3393432 RepID=UPI003CEC4B91
MVSPVPAPQALQLHRAAGPAWRCEVDGEPFPCSAWRDLPVDEHFARVLLAVFTVFLGPAIRDLRGRPEGPTPPEIVKRFLWFLPLTDEEARATALRCR